MAADTPLPPSSFDIRTKVLAVVAFAALVPTLAVGIASYLTARQILVEKVNRILSDRTSEVREELTAWLEDRQRDADVFAHAFLIVENLEAWHDASVRRDETSQLEARQHILEYLDGVRSRFPDYDALLVLDPSARTVAVSGDASRIRLPGVDALESGVAIEGRGELSRLVVRASVGATEGRPNGTLVAVSSLGGLWARLDLHRPENGRLRIFDTVMGLLHATDGEIEGLPFALPDGARSCLDAGSGVVQYTDWKGQRVLSGCETAPHRLGVVVEMDRQVAFETVYRLRDFTLLIFLLATALIGALGYGLVGNLTRPIEALTGGAQAVLEGDLSQQIPITSKDEIGYLTEVFNTMIRTLRESHRRLAELSATDELTGLGNRRQLSEAFGRELSRAQRSDQAFSLVMIDLDHFKSFNDRHGHLEGDAVLRRLGAFLRAQLRPGDVPARYGGEEFLILLPDTGRREARLAAERLHKAFVAAEDEEGALRVTMSLGVASWPGDGDTEEELLAAADRALYEAKRLGRNRVVASAAGVESNEDSSGDVVEFRPPSSG